MQQHYKPNNALSTQGCADLGKEKASYFRHNDYFFARKIKLLDSLSEQDFRESVGIYLEECTTMKSQPAESVSLETDICGIKCLNSSIISDDVCVHSRQSSEQ